MLIIATASSILNEAVKDYREGKRRENTRIRRVVESVRLVVMVVERGNRLWALM